MAKTYEPWTTTEEIALCKAWCEAMENYGTRDMKTGFWSEVFANFQKEMEGTIRGYDTVVVKWKNLIRPKVDAFSVVYDSVQRMDENRSSDLVLFQNVLAEFQTGYGHPFTMEACWRILKNHAAWTEIEVPTYQRHNGVFNPLVSANGVFNPFVDFAFPRDVDGHGIHTDAIAAGNNGIHVKVQGYEFGKASGMAPRARLICDLNCDMAEVVEQEALKEKTDSGNKQEEEKCSILVWKHVATVSTGLMKGKDGELSTGFCA
ncbi:UBN2 domain-containing protein [Tanacetum coccineum]